MAVNKYKVPKKMWRRLGVVGQRVFNETFSTMVNNQGLFLHPDDKPRFKNHWRTTAWNAALFAAYASRNALDHIAVKGR